MFRKPTIISPPYPSDVVHTGEPMDDTVYRTPDGRRWRKAGIGKYGMKAEYPDGSIHMVLVKNGYRCYILKSDLTEEKIWLKNRKKST